MQNSEKRTWLRLDKVFHVLCESPHFGFMNCVARNISCGGLFLETRAPLPLGSPIRVYFAFPGGAAGISALGEVKNHYFLNYKSGEGPATITGMGVRFTQFDSDGASRLEQSVEHARMLH
jgi:uncharacterized protein (TIGR02266 family)